MIVHRSDSVFDGNIFVFVVTGPFAYSKQKVKVHHIVDDYREVPASEIPRADSTDRIIEASAKIVRCFFHDSFNSIIRSQTFGIAVAAVDHETQVMCAFIVAYRIQKISILNGICFQRIVSCQLVGIPQ